LVVLLPVAACDGALNGEPNFDRGTLATNSADVSKDLPAVCKDQLTSSPGDVSDVTARNNCIYAEMGQIDEAYYEYRKSLHGLNDNGNAIGDVVGVGLSAAATAVTGASAKTVLSAINLGLGSTKTKIDEDILYSNSISLILTQMDADRADWKSRILAQMDDPAKNQSYTMYAAAIDLMSYYEAGTWDHALSSLNTQSSVNLNNCQAAVKNAETPGNASSNATSSTGCGPQQPALVTEVPADVQTIKAAQAAYVKSLALPADADKLDALAKAFGVPQGADEAVGIVEKLDAATTLDAAQQNSVTIKNATGKDI
jgi:hypothetical protein